MGAPAIGVFYNHELVGWSVVVSCFCMCFDLRRPVLLLLTLGRLGGRGKRWSGHCYCIKTGNCGVGKSLEGAGLGLAESVEVLGYWRCTQNTDMDREVPSQLTGQLDFGLRQRCVLLTRLVSCLVHI